MVMAVVGQHIGRFRATTATASRVQSQIAAVVAAREAQLRGGVRCRAAAYHDRSHLLSRQEAGQTGRRCAGRRLAGEVIAGARVAGARGIQ